MREAVRNALAHSGCTRIEISLEVDDAGLRGRVEDDGSGFDPHGGGRDDRTDGGPATGVGLRFMRERMELLGSHFDAVKGVSYKGSGLAETGTHCII
jgi:signal transduction histidine kinase